MVAPFSSWAFLSSLASRWTSSTGRTLRGFSTNVFTPACDQKQVLKTAFIIVAECVVLVAQVAQEMKMGGCN